MTHDQTAKAAKFIRSAIALAEDIGVPSGAVNAALCEILNRRRDPELTCPYGDNNGPV